jgi:hypothetical protein
LIPVLLIFIPLWQLTGLELAQAVSEILSALISIPFILTFFKHLPPDQSEQLM